MHAVWQRPEFLTKVTGNRGLIMKRIIRVTAIVGLGLLTTACDKCGNWNLNTPQLRHGAKPQG